MTKASALLKMKAALTKSKVADIFVFTVKDWKNDSKEVVARIQSEFTCEKIIIRSSSPQEDAMDASFAGCFYTAIDIDIKDKELIASEVAKVIASYAKRSEGLDHYEILVQTMLSDVSMSEWCLLVIWIHMLRIILLITMMCLVKQTR